MASFINCKLPPYVEKPPLFSLGYQTVGANSLRAASHSGFSAFPCTSGASSALATPSNDFKIQKIERELDFCTDSDPPSLKRMKISDESQLMQPDRQDEEGLANDSFRGCMKSFLWDGGLVYDAWFSCASNQPDRQDEEGLGNDSFRGCIRSFLYNVGLVYNAWFSCTSNQPDRQDEEGLANDSFRGCIRSFLWDGSYVYDAWFSCASNQVPQVLVTLPYSFSQWGMASGVIFQVFYCLMGS